MKKEPVMTHREYGRELKKAWAAHDQSSVDYLLDHFAVGNEGVFTIDHADRTDKKERANHRGNDSKSNKDAM